jgi:hypothetical protein
MRRTRSVRSLPIIKSADPAEAAARIIEEMRGAAENPPATNWEG